MDAVVAVVASDARLTIVMFSMKIRLALAFRVFLTSECPEDVNNIYKIFLVTTSSMFGSCFEKGKLKVDPPRGIINFGSFPSLGKKGKTTICFNVIVFLGSLLSRRVPFFIFLSSLFSRMSEQKKGKKDPPFYFPF